MSKTPCSSGTRSPRTTGPRCSLQLEYDGKTLPEDEVVGNVLLTFGGGVDTTAQLTGWTLYHLGKDPELRERLREDRALLHPAFDEFLRFACPVQGIARTIPQDTALGDFALRGGRKIFVALAAANRDPEVFPNPDVIDIERNAKRHLGLGADRTAASAPTLHACGGRRWSALCLTASPTTSSTTTQWRYIRPGRSTASPRCR